MRISKWISFILYAVLIVTLSFPSWSGIWLYIPLGSIFAILPFSIWQMFSKSPSVEITNEVITINGLKIDRQDVLEWRVFRTSSNGHRGRYIELKLARVPNDTLRWKLAKIFEQVAPSMRFDRKVSLAREPRIIASLKSWDLQESEIAHALQNGKNEGASGGDQA